MIYELRLYSITHGRMADQHGRFTDHLPALFARHGIQCVGGWTALAGPSAPRFVYMMAYRDYAHREAVWASFYADPNWLRVRTETNAGHEMVEQLDLFFLKPNAVWQLDAAASPANGEVHELVLQKLAPGQNAAANEFLATTYLPRLKDAGGRTLGVFDMASGNDMQKLVLFLSWPDARAWWQGRLALEADPELREAFAAQRKKLGHPIFGRTESNVLQPVPGMPILPDLGRTA